MNYEITETKLCKFIENLIISEDIPYVTKVQVQSVTDYTTNQKPWRSRIEIRLVLDSKNVLQNRRKFESIRENVVDKTRNIVNMIKKASPDLDIVIITKLD